MHKITLQLQWKHQFEFAGFYAAIAQGFYAQRGLQVELREYQTDMDIIEEVLSGRVQYATTNSSIVRSRLEGKPVKLLANYFKRMPMVILSSPEITKLDDLRGKRLMLSQKDLQSPLLKLVFERKDLKPGENIEIIPHSFNADPFINGEVDAMSAFITNEPFYLEQHGIKFNVLELADYMRSIGDVYLFTSDTQTEQYPQQTKDFIEASNEGWRYALDHPQEIIELILSDYSQRKSREALVYEAEKTHDMIMPLPLPIGVAFEPLIDEVAAMIMRQDGIGDKNYLQRFLFDTEEKKQLERTPVIKLTTAERAWLDAHPKIVLGYTNQFQPDIIRNPDGTYSGTLIEHINLINQYLDNRLHLHIENTWAVVTDKAVKLEIDGLAASTPNSVWDQHFIYAEPYTFSYFYLYTHASEPNPPLTLGELEGKSVGYLSGVKKIEQLLRTLPDIQLKGFNSNEAMANALLNNQVAALVSSSNLEWWRTQHNNFSFKISGLIEESRFPVVMSIRKDWPLLKSIVDKALKIIPIAEFERIQQSWQGHHQETKKTGLSLTPEQRVWLKQHPSLRYCFNPLWKPYDFFENDQHQGVFADYLHLLTNKLGVEFIPVPTIVQGDAGKSWKKALDFTRQRHCDFISGAVKTTEREAYLGFTQPYFNITQVFIAKPDKPFASGLEVFHDETIGVLAHSALKSFLQHDYPNLKLLSLNINEMVVRLEADEIYAFAVPLEHATQLLQERVHNLKIISKLDYSYPISIAVRNDWPILADIMNQAVASLSQLEHTQVQRKWTTHTLKETLDYTLLWQVLGTALLILVLMLYWNHKLRHEILERKKAEYSLYESEEKYRRLFELSDDPMWLICDHQLILANTAAVRILGYNSALELSNQHPAAHSPPYQHSGQASKQLADKMMQLAYHHGHHHFEWLHQKRNGSVFPVEVSLTRIPYEGENALFCIWRDITDRIKTQHALQKAKEEAEAANRAKSAFLANMSHELRTPLNAIMGFAQILAQSPRLGDSDKRQVNSIYRGGEYLLILINDILDLAKVEAGRIELFPTAINIQLFVQELVDMFRLRAKKKNINFKYHTDISLPNGIYADATRLRQILVNLLGNAVKFTEQGHVCLQISYDDDTLHIHVEDTGIGIAPEQHEEIFQPFSQTSENRYKAQGTGLGLSITRQIIELMGGTLSLESQLGQGSCFYVQVPAKAILKSFSSSQKKLPQETIIGYHHRKGEAPLRILVTDDIADNREVLCQILRPLNFDTQEADSGENCLQLIAAYRPHLVLMDLRMPGLDGLETTRRLHELPGFEKLPVIVISAGAYGKDEKNSRAAGCVDYLAKPIERTLLLQTLQKYLPLQWIYDKQQTTSTVSTDSGTIVELSAKWLEALEQAVIEANLKQVKSLLEEIKAEDSKLAAQLTDWLEAYEYQQLLDWIETHKQV
ncbi:transporter substrate-binding domain-containing protein [Candidatus Venteria ishoeyi]|uniref:ABC transporter substrate-binding protein n=1 Tax=Candidatus Venteria ishoeyi TaxID=1899563 RepID=UPI0025A509B6|nr:transporter substrate-binding domain-containing protein [Candidatus Venteria ishoeyi]MDM8547360.1 transporter substrate-binding domain-containing protein [Candidatus Venteria ishoeyi]